MEVLTEENEQTENRYGLQRVPISPNQPFSRELEFVEQTNNPILQEQAIRLFELCDWNNKGFIVRSDLDRLESVLPRAQLESVFDKQDKERVGVVNRANFLEGIKSLLLKHMNDYNMDREKKADHGLPTYINTYNPTEDASDPIRKRSSMLIIDETLNSDNSHNHDNNYFNTISLAESEDEKDGHKGGRNMRKQDTQTRQNVHQKTRKLTIAIEPSGDYENNNRVGLAKFHSIDDYGDGIIGCPSPVYSPHSDKYASNRLGSSKKNSREERNQKSKSSGRPPFSAIVPAIESPTEETSTVKNDPIKGEISPIPPPPPYRSISQPAKLPRNFSELAGNAELDGFSISEEIDPFYLNRQLSQPVHYENGQHTQFFYDYDDEEASGTAAERRNRFQFAKVIERDSISHTDLTHITPPRYGDCDFRRSTCEHSLADEMRDATRKYRGTTDLDLRTPDRIFKVSYNAVGKTCFLHRFCHNRFKPLFNATIGVDFTVKTVRLQDRLVAVQLWDTAGQERFRSITKQYFRKADGVVLMYDVTSEQSFLNVRNWIESVRVGVDDGCVMCLVGNKVDLYPNEQCRTVTYKHGKDLAEEFDMVFFETSAYTGMGINECMRALAFRLQQREMEHMEEALKLEMTMNSSKSSSWCCV